MSDVADRNLSPKSGRFDSLLVKDNHQPEASFACDARDARFEAKMADAEVTALGFEIASRLSVLSGKRGQHHAD